MELLRARARRALVPAKAPSAPVHSGVSTRITQRRELHGEGDVDVSSLCDSKCGTYIQTSTRAIFGHVSRRKPQQKQYQLKQMRRGG